VILFNPSEFLITYFSSRRFKLPEPVDIHKKPAGTGRNAKFQYWFGILTGKLNRRLKRPGGRYPFDPFIRSFYEIKEL
jgi:hypothetical protein